MNNNMGTLLIAAACLTASFGVTAETYQFKIRMNGMMNPALLCVSDTSTVEDGQYKLCAMDDGKEYPVIDGNAFRVDYVSQPKDAFDCPSGTNRYANHFEAEKLAALLSRNIFTPWGSWLNHTRATSAYKAEGRAVSVKPDGTKEFDSMYRFSMQSSGEYYTRYYPQGDYYTLGSSSLSSKRRYWYPYNINNNSKGARRACTLNL